MQPVSLNAYVDSTQHKRHEEDAPSSQHVKSAATHVSDARKKAVFERAVQLEPCKVTHCQPHGISRDAIYTQSTADVPVS